MRSAALPSRSSERPAITTVAPSSAKRLAVSKPMPALAPVTSTVLPRISIDSLYVPIGPSRLVGAVPLLTYLHPPKPLTPSNSASRRPKRGRLLTASGSDMVTAARVRASAPQRAAGCANTAASAAAAHSTSAADIGDRNFSEGSCVRTLYFRYKWYETGLPRLKASHRHHLTCR